MIGQQINQFKILEKLGSGGMGEVYLAEDTKLDRKVALKFLPAHYSQDADFKARFEHEAKATAALNHHNIITVHDLGEHEGRLYIAMEQVDGQTLEQIIAAGGITIPEAIGYTKQICDGLSAAHEAGIVHRDIKPANILVNKRGRVKILDFGLAKSRKATTETKAGTTVGTIQYEAPEQSRGGDVDGRSDLFSLGVVLYEMVAGQRPFTGEFEDAVRYAIANENPEPLARYKSDVPDELQRIVTKLLEKEPDLRYQSAVGLMSDLRTLQRDSGPHSSAIHSAVQSSVQPAAKKKGIGRILIPAGLVVVAVAILLVLKPWSVDIQPTQEAAATEDKLAVMYFENLADPEDSKNQGSIVANLVISDFSESEYIKVVSSQRLYDILKNLGKEGEKHISPDVASTIALRANAKWMVTGSILQSEPTFAISAQLVEVSTGNILASPTVRGQPGQDIFDVVDQLTVGIRSDLALPAAARDEADPSVKTLTSASAEAYGLYLQGMDSVRQYKHITAEQLFREALELDTTFAMAYYHVAMIRLAQWGDYAGALDLLGRAVDYSANANEWERLLIFGMHHWFKGRFDEALQNFAELVAKYPEEKAGYRTLAAFYRSAPGYVDVQRSIELTTQIIELDSLDDKAYNLLAYDYDRMGNYEKSISAIEKYIELNPGAPNPIDSRAELYANNGQIQKALQSYLQVIEIDPNFSSAYSGAFAMYAYLGQMDEAERLIARMDSHPDPDVQFRAAGHRGYLALYRGKFKSALGVFDVLDQEPQSRAELSPHIGRLGNARFIYSYLGDHKRSLRIAERINELAGDVDTTGGTSAWALGTLINQAVWAGELDRMDSLFREQTARYERLGLTPPLFEPGLVALAHGRGDSAIHCFERWAEGGSNCANLYWLGQAYASAERTRDAVSAFEDALERYDRSRWFNPIESTRIHFLLAKAYEKAGRSDKAAEQYRAFLELWKDADTEVDEIRYAKRRLTQLGA